MGNQDLVEVALTRLGRGTAASMKLGVFLFYIYILIQPGRSGADLSKIILEFLIYNWNIFCLHYVKSEIWGPKNGKSSRLHSNIVLNYSAPKAYESLLDFKRLYSTTPSI